jgi:hypothetical protein
MMATIETTAHDALNAGLGLFKTLEGQIAALKAQAEKAFEDLKGKGPDELIKSAEGQFAELRTKIEKSYDELVAKGAADQSEQVVQLRNLLDQGLTSVKELQTKIEGTFKN